LPGVAAGGAEAVAGWMAPAPGTGVAPRGPAEDRAAAVAAAPGSAGAVAAAGRPEVCTSHWPAGACDAATPLPHPAQSNPATVSASRRPRIGNASLGARGGPPPHGRQSTAAVPGSA